MKPDCIYPYPPTLTLYLYSKDEPNPNPNPNTLYSKDEPNPNPNPNTLYSKDEKDYSIRIRKKKATREKEVPLSQTNRSNREAKLRIEQEASQA